MTATAQCNQIKYSAETRAIESVTLDWQRARRIQTMAYWPLGRYGQARLARHPVLEKLGRERGVTAAQIALAWCTRSPDVIAIPKSTNFERLEQNLAAADLRLRGDELEEIDRAFPLQGSWLHALHQLSSVHRARSVVSRVASQLG